MKILYGVKSFASEREHWTILCTHDTEQILAITASPAPTSCALQPISLNLYTYGIARSSGGGS